MGIKQGVKHYSRHRLNGVCGQCDINYAHARVN